jgi:glycosyltransferase involved in cell wall biosynthesis
MILNRNEPFVSVLTPVYNGEKFLRECIESVLAQDYKNWEYVIVNNCSTDGSLQIARKYAEKDSRITIYNNSSFLNVMDNLNHSFHQISTESKYCKVVHADDWLFPTCLSKMVSLAEENSKIGIVGSFFLDDLAVQPNYFPYTENIIPGKVVGETYFLDKITLFGPPSILLIRSDLIRNRENMYDPNNIHSDHGACLDIFREYDLGFVHEVLTYSRRHNESHTNRLANKFDTYLIGRIKNLKEYGPYYIGQKKTDQLFVSYMNTYYQKFVKWSIVQCSKDIYDYHINQIKQMGEKIEYSKIAKNSFLTLFNVKLYYAYIKKLILS